MTGLWVAFYGAHGFGFGWLSHESGISDVVPSSFRITALVVECGKYHSTALGSSGISATGTGFSAHLQRQSEAGTT
jgi:hypothetical protein